MILDPDSSPIVDLDTLRELCRRGECFWRIYAMYLNSPLQVFLMNQNGYGPECGSETNPCYVEYYKLTLSIFRLFFGVLPASKTSWAATMKQHRSSYYVRKFSNNGS